MDQVGLQVPDRLPNGTDRGVFQRIISASGKSDIIVSTTFSAPEYFVLFNKCRTLIFLSVSQQFRIDILHLLTDVPYIVLFQCLFVPGTLLPDLNTIHNIAHQLT